MSLICEYCKQDGFSDHEYLLDHFEYCSLATHKEIRHTLGIKEVSPVDSFYDLVTRVTSCPRCNSNDLIWSPFNKNEIFYSCTVRSCSWQVKVVISKIEVNL
jgi:hypothetical protein